MSFEGVSNDWRLTSESSRSRYRVTPTPSVCIRQTTQMVRFGLVDLRHLLDDQILVLHQTRMGKVHLKLPEVAYKSF